MRQRSPLDVQTIAQMKALQGNKPLYQFAKLLGLSVPTVATAMVGANVHPGTRALLAQKILELTAGNPATVGEVAA